MATRSLIGILTKSNTVESVYCHFDGYPEGVGARLARYYTTAEKAENLLSFGNISSLGVTTADTVFYSRDRNESLENNKARTSFGFTQYQEQAKGSGCEYAYIFRNGEWEVIDLLEGWVKKVKEAIK